MHTDFSTSEFKALALGYQKVTDTRAYGGVYYLKDGKRWIFNLTALGRALGISTPQEFAAAGYAIDDFLLYGALSIPEFLRLLPDKDTAGENAPQPESTKDIVLKVRMNLLCPGCRIHYINKPRNKVVVNASR